MIPSSTSVQAAIPCPCTACLYKQTMVCLSKCSSAGVWQFLNLLALLKLRKRAMLPVVWCLTMAWITLRYQYRRNFAERNFCGLELIRKTRKNDAPQKCSIISAVLVLLVFKQKSRSIQGCGTGISTANALSVALLYPSIVNSIPEIHVLKICKHLVWFWENGV